MVIRGDNADDPEIPAVREARQGTPSLRAVPEREETVVAGSTGVPESSSRFAVALHRSALHGPPHIVYVQCVRVCCLLLETFSKAAFQPKRLRQT